MSRIARPTVSKKAAAKRAEPTPEAKAEVEVTDTAEEVEEEAAAEVEAKAEATAPAAEAPDQVPATATAQSTAVQAAHQSTNVMAQAAEEGFEGLELGFGSFETIRLDSGEFIKSDKNAIGTKLVITPIQSRVLHVYAQDEEGGDIIYSYDGITATNGDNVEDVVAEWREDEIPYKSTDRLEVTCQVLDGGDLTGEMAILSMPPTARKRFSGVWATAKLRGMDLANLQIEVSVGKAIRSGTNSFNPWVFKILS